jgi:hypothetical protein
MAVSKEYISWLEKQNEELTNKLGDFELIREILGSKVKIDSCSVIKCIDPYRLCGYMESLGWTQKYEKVHERFLTRCYISPHKDTKCKVFLSDVMTSTNDFAVNGERYSGLNGKILEVVSVLARLHKKGELEVIYEVMSFVKNVETSK